MTSPAERRPRGLRGPRRARGLTVLCWTMLGAVVCGGLGFVYKLAQFIREALGSEAASFAVVPVAVYVLVALGFVSLFVWALLRGQFRDIEGPKHRLLEMEEEHERAGV
ncbi:MAG: cbb3-type cytochrome oxidase assembly protein [Planctomycetes bacterium]|nr:cbb3-type cytochrome oxidase assembly protein [Planctomycetota bacterium]